MQLAVHQDDADILLTEKNELNIAILDKYKTAGHIAQTWLRYVINLINDSYHLGKTEKPYTLQELCILGDSMAVKLLGQVYNNKDKVREKGMAQPTQVDFNQYVSNVSPDADNRTEHTLVPGDIVTISVGAHIDGYTALASHTVVIYPPGVMVDGQLKPEGPLLGNKADAIVAGYIATEALIALLGLAVTPEKIGAVPGLAGNTSIGGHHIRAMVDDVARSFGCVVAPGSKVRRMRRFLAGQAEGIVAERDFKGVVWTESDQEAQLLQKNGEKLLVKQTSTSGASEAAVASSSAVPDDEFVVEAGEVYNIDIRMCSVSEFKEKGLVTLAETDEFTDPLCRPSVFIRDHAMTHALRLKAARDLVNHVDKQCSVYPFKLLHLCEGFPVENGDAEELETIRKQLAHQRLGLKEAANRYLIRAKPAQVARHVPLSKMLLSANPTGRHGIDESKLSLPGREIPLPALGISGVKLKALLKHSEVATAVSRESVTIVLNSVGGNILQLTGGSTSFRPPWVHLQYQVNGECLPMVQALSQLMEDKRFGIQVKETQPLAS